MDPKASAKSKRSHSQHGRRSHPTPSAPGSHKNKKPTQVKGSEQVSDHKPKPPRPSRPSLPSNRDRYDEDYEFEVEQRETLITAESEKKVEGGGDTVVVKSKGADYRYLIEQARSQPQVESLRNAATADSYASTVDVPDYFGGFGSMLLARGKGLFVSCGDDNFVVDDTTTSKLEIPFLSLDLSALEAQLARLKTSERLFIEPEYIAEELELDTVANLDESESKSSLVPPGFGAREETETASKDFNPESRTHSDWSNKKKEKTPLTISRDSEVSISGAHGKRPPSGSHHGSAVTKEPSTSDAAAAKSEFDALLDSLGEHEISGSPRFSGLLNSNSDGLAEPHIKSTNLDSIPQSDDLSLTNCGFKASEVDGAIDDLLLDGQHSDFSYNTEDRNKFGVRDVFASAGSVSTTRFPGSPSLDDSIDDLLAETSSFDVQKSSLFSRKGPQGSVESKASAISDTLSKALDDLDSLLDL